MRIGLAFTLILPILPGQAVHTCLGSENSSPDRFVLHSQKQINIIQTGKEKCERKAYPLNICADRNRVRLRVNEA